VAARGARAAAGGAGGPPVYAKIVLLPEIKRGEFWKHCGSKREGTDAHSCVIEQKSQTVKLSPRRGNVGLFEVERKKAQSVAFDS
jgi:hypothetical protein